MAGRVWQQGQEAGWLHLHPHRKWWGQSGQGQFYDTSPPTAPVMLSLLQGCATPAPIHVKSIGNAHESKGARRDHPQVCRPVLSYTGLFSLVKIMLPLQRLPFSVPLLSVIWGGILSFCSDTAS